MAVPTARLLLHMTPAQALVLDSQAQARIILSQIRKIQEIEDYSLLGPGPLVGLHWRKVRSAVLSLRKIRQMQSLSSDGSQKAKS